MLRHDVYSNGHVASSHPVLPNARTFYQLMHRRKRKDLTIRCLQQSAHVFASHFESPARDASYHVIVFVLIVAQRAQPLYACDLVACRTVILCQFCLDQRSRREFVWDDEIGSLIESWNTLGAGCLAKADFCLGENILDCDLDDLANQLAHRVAVRRKRPAEEAFIEKNGIRCAKIRRWIVGS